MLVLFVAGAKERKKYAAKVKFINQHFEMDDPFLVKQVLEDDLMSAVEWGAARSDQEAMFEWERIMSGIEQVAEGQQRTGACGSWFGDADAIMRKVAFFFCMIFQVSMCLCDRASGIGRSQWPYHGGSWYGGRAS